MSLENTLTEPKQSAKKKKSNVVTQILRKCLCLGKPKSLSDISTVSDEKVIDVNTTRDGKRYWHSTVNQVYTVEDDPARGFKPIIRNPKKRVRKRPSFKINTIKGRSKDKLRKMKSSELNCCIEWKGQNEGNIKFGKNSKKKCLHFKIDRWAKLEDDKDGERSYSLQAVLLPE